MSKLTNNNFDIFLMRAWFAEFSSHSLVPFYPLCNLHLGAIEKFYDFLQCRKEVPAFAWEKYANIYPCKFLIVQIYSKSSHTSAVCQHENGYKLNPFVCSPAWLLVDPEHHFNSGRVWIPVSKWRGGTKMPPSALQNRWYAYFYSIVLFATFLCYQTFHDILPCLPQSIYVGNWWF